MALGLPAAAPGGVPPDGERDAAAAASDEVAVDAVPRPGAVLQDVASLAEAQDVTLRGEARDVPLQDAAQGERLPAEARGVPFRAAGAKLVGPLALDPAAAARCGPGGSLPPEAGSLPQAGLAAGSQPHRAFRDEAEKFGRDGPHPGGAECSPDRAEPRRGQAACRPAPARAGPHRHVAAHRTYRRAVAIRALWRRERVTVADHQDERRSQARYWDGVGHSPRQDAALARRVRAARRLVPSSLAWADCRERVAGEDYPAVLRGAARAQSGPRSLVAGYVDQPRSAGPGAAATPR